MRSTRNGKRGTAAKTQQTMSLYPLLGAFPSNSLAITIR